MDRLLSVEVFVRTVELGGLTAAAQELDMSPTMVSKHLRDIERRLAVRLFNRTTRRQSLTEAGSIYYAHCKELLEKAKEADDSVAALQSSPSGVLRIFSAVTIGVHVVTPLLSPYLESLPQVRVELALSDRSMDLVEEGFDAAITIGNLEDSRYVVRPLRPYRMAMGASPKYLAAHPAPLHPDELAVHNCLTFALWDRQDAWHLVGPDGEFQVPVRGNFRVNSGQALMESAVAGMGVVLQPEVLLQPAFDDGRLVRILPGYAPPARPVSLLYVADRRMTPKLRTFINYLVENLGLRA